MHRSASTSNAFKEKLFNAVSDTVPVFQETYSGLAMLLLVKHKSGANSELHLSVPDTCERRTRTQAAILFSHNPYSDWIHFTQNGGVM